MNHTDTHFQTPAIVCKFMASIVQSLPHAKEVLEPTPGQGNLVKALQQANFEVTAPENFFSMERKKYDCVVMNPPYSKKFVFGYPEEWAQKKKISVPYFILKASMELSDNIIALIPFVVFLNSEKRLKELMNFGLVSVISLPRKTFPGSRVHTCIIVLKKGHTATTIFQHFTW